MVDNITRRRYLASVGAVSAIGVAGCSETSGSNGGNGGSGGSGDSESDYPSQSIKTIIPYGAGGGTDTYLRNIIPGIEKAVGVDMPLENIPGAATLRAQGQLAASEPDGYTMMATVFPGTASAGMINPPSGFDPSKFVQVCGFAKDHGILATNPDDEVEGYADIKDRFEDGEFSTIGGTFLGSPHLIAFVSKNLHGLNWQEFVGFEGTGSTLKSVASGELDVGLGSPGAALGLVEGGNIDIPSVLTSSPAPQFPDAPTVTDEGFEQMDYVSLLTRTFEMPAGTPKDTRSTLSEKIKVGIESDEVQDWAEETGNPTEWIPMDDVQSLYDDLFEKVPQYVDLDLLREESENQN